MKKFVLIFTLLSFLLYFPSCKGESSSKQTELRKIIESDKNSTPPQISTKKILKKFPPSQLDPNRILVKKVEIIPGGPTIRDSINVNIEVSSQDITGIKFYYLFYNNEKLVKEGEDNTLTSDFFKKNDVIFCDVLILKDGKEVKRVRTNYVKVLDLPPEIVETKLPNNIKVPGNYKIYVKAEDPDKDEINFTIMSPPEISASVDKISPNEAVIILNISDKAPGKEQSIKLKVEDNEKNFVEQELKINFNKKIITKEKPGKKEKKKNIKKKGFVKRREGIPIRKIGF